jgi:hypothetical protein
MAGIAHACPVCHTMQTELYHVACHRFLGFSACLILVSVRIAGLAIFEEQKGGYLSVCIVFYCLLLAWQPDQDHVA